MTMLIRKMMEVQKHSEFPRRFCLPPFLDQRDSWIFVTIITWWHYGLEASPQTQFLRSQPPVHRGCVSEGGGVHILLIWFILLLQLRSRLHLKDLILCFNWEKVERNPISEIHCWRKFSFEFTCDRFQDFFFRGKTIPLQTDCQEGRSSSQSRPGILISEQKMMVRALIGIISPVCLVSDPHRWCYREWRPWLHPWPGDWTQRWRAELGRALATFLQCSKCQMWDSPHIGMSMSFWAFTRILWSDRVDIPDHWTD